MNLRTTLIGGAIAVMAGLPTNALADSTITVDGNPADWTGISTCFNEPTGDGSGTIDVTRACITNDNSSGDVGSVYMLIQNINTSIGGTYFGWAYDKDQDAVIDSDDEVWYVQVPSNVTSPITTIVVADPKTFATRRTYTTTSNCGGSGTSNGWSAVANGNTIELRISYGCIGWSYNNDYRGVQLGAYPALDSTDLSWFNGTLSPNTLDLAATPPDVGFFTVASGPGKNVLTWNNSSEHYGTLILRQQGQAVTFAPVTGTSYAVGAQLGKNKDVVVYADGMSGATPSGISSYTDTGVTEPTSTGTVTRYYYKVFNQWQSRTYSAGNAPTTSGLYGEPTKTTRPSGWNGPLWCYSTGFSSFVQPTHRKNIGVYGAGNLAAVSANNTVTTSQSLDGLERFRPVQLSGAVQDRFTVASAGGITAIFTGDQSGRLTALSSDSGGTLWSANGGSPLASSIQSTPVFQAAAYSGTAFNSAFGTDVVFVASRNGSSTSNRVFAVRSSDGAVLWSGPKDPSTGAFVNMDIVSGAPWADYDTSGKNRLWVGARNGGGGQPGLYVLNTLDGTVIKTFTNAGVDLPVFKDNTLNQMIVVDNNGQVYGYDLNTLNQVWTTNIGGAPASFPYTIGGGFIITRKSLSTKDTGEIMRYTVSGTTVTQNWIKPVANPSYPSIDFTPGAQYIYVGSSDGTVKQFDPNGNLLKTLTVSTAQTGTPGIDTVARRLDVFDANGRLCAFQLPIN